MTQPTQTAEARDLRELLAVVLDALTLPYAVDNYDERIKDRAGWARTVLVAVTDGTSTDIGWEADFLRSKLAAEEAEAGDVVRDRLSPTPEDEAVRRSVDHAFPVVARFLANERGEQQ